MKINRFRYSITPMYLASKRGFGIMWVCGPSGSTYGEPGSDWSIILDILFWRGLTLVVCWKMLNGKMLPWIEDENLEIHS